MTRRKKRPNYFGWTVFGLVLLFGYYFNQVYLPSQPNPFLPTPTPTRAPKSYVTEGEALFNDGKLFQAIEAYKEAIRSSPQDSSLYVSLARLQVWAGQYEEAQTNAESALLLNSKNALAMGVRAWSLDFQGKNSEAMDSIEEAVAADPNNALIQSYYVEILTDAGYDYYDQAATQSRAALALDPGIVETHRARAYLLSQAPDPIPNPDPITNLEEAIEEYKAAIKINKNIPILHMELANNYRRIQATDEAVTEYTLANTLNPSDPEPEYLMSRTYAGVGDYAKAVQYAEQSVNDEPTNPKYRGNYGIMLYRNLRWPEAIDEFRLALNGGTLEDGKHVVGLPLDANDPRVIEYYYIYGLTLAYQNECGEALQIVQNIQSKLRSNEDALAAADKTIQICQDNLNNPVSATSTPEETESATSTPEVEMTETPLPN
ncbi:MAG: tetratricopeptide repeat protein [Anaerolineales bacterium]